MIPKLEKIDFTKFNHVILQLLNEWELQYCFCGSWKFYKDCCFVWKPKWLTDNKIEKINQCIYADTNLKKVLFYKIEEALRDKRCLYCWCNNNSIKSHLFSRNIIEKNCGKIIWWFDYDERGKVIQVRRTPWEIHSKLWCEKHDKELFNLTDNNNYTSLKRERQKTRYKNELLYKFLWFRKKLYEKEMKACFLYSYNFFCRWEMWWASKFYASYTTYNMFCKSFYEQEKFFINKNFNRNIEYNFLLWKEIWKIFDIYYLCSDKDELMYIFIFMPCNWKISAHVYKMHWNYKLSNEWQIRKFISRNSPADLLSYLNYEFKRDNKIFRIPSENRITILSAEDKMIRNVHNSVMSVISWKVITDFDRTKLFD